MSGHTQGPWEYRLSNTPDCEYYHVHGPKGVRVAVTKTEDNARLIAAAPDMFAVCKALVATDCDHDCRICPKTEWGKEKHDPYCPFALAYAAIEKAKGGE